MNEDETSQVPGSGRDDRTDDRAASLHRGSESTRKLREMARRRQEAEAKLGHHLLDAKQHQSE
ncbi:hypothetical protein [Pseudarthrobacter sp. H2]|uniref:hypothetical protein n=1 Tax=Pseudarthrobacter sp. H2 TaxID=3418415 RepID=UPI003CF406E0